MTHDRHLADLCRRIRASDREAFACLFHRLRPALVRYVHRQLGDAAAAHDVVQDVFAALWERRTELDPALSIQALLYRMARYRVLNHARARRVREAHARRLAAAPAAEPPPDPDAGALAERLRAWIAALPERQREAIELTRFAGLSHQQAAAVMDVSPRTVNNHLVRALARLQRQLEAYQSDPA